VSQVARDALDNQVLKQQSDSTQQHLDPFDHMLAAQALIEGAKLVSIDPVFEGFGVKDFGEIKLFPEVGPCGANSAF
jgi:PIN domain nuclease of toxin-antitoxin system